MANFNSLNKLNWQNKNIKIISHEFIIIIYYYYLFVFV